MERFFTERLIAQRRTSPNTIALYRDTFRLLLGFAQQRTGKAPSELELENLDAELIGAFLEHLEIERHNRVPTRNNRLAAVHSLFTYAALRHPEHAELIQRVLAIPAKRTDRRLVSFLTKDEVDALLAAPDRDTWIGRRDHALLVVAVQTGLRVSELRSRHGLGRTGESHRHRLALTDRAGRWVTIQVGRCSRTVNEVAQELECDWHTVNDAVIAYGEALVDGDPDRIGDVTATWVG